MTELGHKALTLTLISALLRADKTLSSGVAAVGEVLAQDGEDWVAVAVAGGGVWAVHRVPPGIYRNAKTGDLPDANVQNFFHGQSAN